MIKICLNCKKSFNTYDYRLIYCDRICYKAYINSVKRWEDRLKIIHKKHWKENKSILELSKEYKISRATIYKWMEKLGLKGRDISETKKLQWNLMTTEKRQKQIENAHKKIKENSIKKFKTNPTRRISKRGYWMIYVPDRGNIKEHHYVWEQFKGNIPEGYVIHHINHDRLDNRIENLQMMTNGEHTRLHHQLRKKNDKRQYI